MRCMFRSVDTERVTQGLADRGEKADAGGAVGQNGEADVGGARWVFLKEADLE